MDINPTATILEGSLGGERIYQQSLKAKETGEDIGPLPLQKL